jgi:transcriptional regulator with XRE-family HTH domain
VKLGDVLKKEREKRGLSAAETASQMKISEQEYEELEGGESPAEEWGPVLAHIAIALETPTSRLLAESGRSQDTEPGQAGRLIAGHRERRGLSVDEVAEKAELEAETYASVEAGDSPVETYGPRLLAFAETVDIPVFNLFYPCGLPFQELDDYP